MEVEKSMNQGATRSPQSRSSARLWVTVKTIISDGHRKTVRRLVHTLKLIQVYSAKCLVPNYISANNKATSCSNIRRRLKPWDIVKQAKYPAKQSNLRTCHNTVLSFAWRHIPQTNCKLQEYDSHNRIPYVVVKMTRVDRSTVSDRMKISDKEVLHQIKRWLAD